MPTARAPAALLLLLLLLLLPLPPGLPLAPPAASLPLASPRRLPPPPPPPPRPLPPAAEAADIESGQQARRSSHPSTRPCGSCAQGTEAAPASPGQRRGPGRIVRRATGPWPGRAAALPPPWSPRPDSGGPSPPVSISTLWEQPGGPGAAPASLRSSTGTSMPLPSSSPSSLGTLSSPGQPESSPSAPGARAGGSSRAPRPGRSMEEPTSPMTASPASGTASGATGSSQQSGSDQAAENRTWDFQTGTSSPVTRPQTSSLWMQDTSISPGSTGLSMDHQPPSSSPALERTGSVNLDTVPPSPTHPDLPFLKAPGAQSPAAAIGSSYQPSDFSAVEEGISRFPSTSAYNSTPSTRGGARTIRSLPSSTSLTNATEISTSGSKVIRPSDQTQSSGMSSAAEAGGGTGATATFTDPLPPGSASASESTSKTLRSTYEPKSISDAAEGTSRTATHGAAAAPARTSAAAKSLGTAGSSSIPRATSSSGATGRAGGTASSSAARTRGMGGSRDATSATALAHTHSAMGSASTGFRSSPRPTRSSATETRAAGSAATRAYIVATVTSMGGRTLRSVTNTSKRVAEGSTSGTGMSQATSTGQSSSSIRETYRVNGSRAVTDVTEPLADPSLTHSQSVSETPSAATGRDHVSLIPSTGKRMDFPNTTAYVSASSTRGGGRTLRSLPSSTSLTNATEISTSGTKMIRPLDRTQSSGMALEAGATVTFMDLLLSGSASASESTSPAKATIISDMEKSASEPPLPSASGAATATEGAERTVEPGANISASPGAAESSMSLDPIQLSSSVVETGSQHNISQSDDEFRELSTQPLPIFSSSLSVSSSSLNTSGREERVTSVPTDSTYTSTAFSTRGEGISEAPGGSSTWNEVTESSTSNLEVARESGSSPIPSATVWPEGGPFFYRDAGYTKPPAEVTFSSRASTAFSASQEPSTTGSSHHSLSSSGTEKRVSRAHTAPAYGSAAGTGSGERTLRSVTNGTLAQGTESSTSHVEIANSSEAKSSVPREQSRTPNISASSLGVTGLATETLFTRSSKVPTYSSFQNDLSGFPSSHQPVSTVDLEKRTSVSHTDGTYISTTYTRGGERTLLSISNSSTSAESSESSTFFSEISSPSDSSQLSSVTQDRRSNVSSDSSFIEPSTEPLLVHSSKLLTSASTGPIQNTTILDTDPELLPTGRSSLSSSAFPSSSSVPSLHYSPSSTPSPAYLFASSEASELLSSSTMASSHPLQALSSAVPTSSLLSSSYSLTSLLPLSSSPSSASQSSDSSQTSTLVAATEARQVPSTAAITGSSPRETSKPSGTHQPQDSTALIAAGFPPLPTGPMEQLGSRAVSMSAPVHVTESPSPSAASPKEGGFGKTTPPLTTASDTPSAGTTGTPRGASLSTTSQKVVPPAVPLTTVNPPVLTTSAVHRPTPAQPSTPKVLRPLTPIATETVHATSQTTEAVDRLTANTGRVTEENIPVTNPPEAPPPTKTTVSVATTSAAATKPTTLTPLSSTAGLRTPPPVTDVDECLSNPCPALATCNNTHGSYICQCPLGYELEKGKCNLVRIFIGQVPLKPNITHGKYAELPHIEGEILAMLDASLATLSGYHRSVVKATREANIVHVSVQSTFSLASNVTFYDVITSVKSYIRACTSPPETCQFISNLRPLHRVGSLCKQKDPECDKETSECTDFDGVALCQCKSGYFKYNKMDHSCRACDDGYKLENETCVRCPFGLGGFNCGNPYQLITVVIAAAGGGLLLILGIALIVTCCRKNKNDISKLIFKSGDFQMSPYAEYPKNPRAQEWGRETIEMQENGSTKNLLQMTDVYYSPTGLRNPELERNGLYPPYTGLPGSRHSCIYPGQYNPSFISDETRRRDYF